jgi:hypothetical protein
MGILVILGTLVALVVILLLIGVILPSGNTSGEDEDDTDAFEGSEE